jgi:hypothetical protein
LLLLFQFLSNQNQNGEKGEKKKKGEKNGEKKGEKNGISDRFRLPWPRR